MKNKKKRSPVKTLLFIFFFVVLFLLLIFVLYKVDFFNMFNFSPTQNKNNSENPEYSEKINGIMNLLSENNKPEYKTAAVNPDEIESIISNSQFLVNYYHEYKVTYTWKNYSTSKLFKVLKYGKCWNIQIFEGDVHTQTIICDGQKYNVRDEISGETNIFSLSSTFSFDSFANVTPISDILNLMESYRENSTDKSHISESTADIVRSSMANVAFVNLIYDSGERSEEYMIHLDFGVIVSAASTISSEKYYQLETIKITDDISEFDVERLFNIE